MVDRLIPSDALGPGAREARAAHYIDRALGGALASVPSGLHVWPGCARSLRACVARQRISRTVRHRQGLGADGRRSGGGDSRHLRRQLGAVLHARAEPHEAGHVWRSVLRRQREFRRMGSDRLPGRADDGDGRRSEGAAKRVNSSRITSRPTTSRASTRQPRAWSRTRTET